MTDFPRKGHNTSIPQKRILSDITNDIPRGSAFNKPKRRNSLGFEMVSVPQIEKESMKIPIRPTKPTSIPPAPQLTKMTPQENIKRMKSVSARLKSSTIQEGLRRKGPALKYSDDWSKALQEKSQRDLENQTTQLDQEIRALEQEEHECNMDLSEARRQKRKKEKDILEVTIEIESEERKRAFIEEKVVKTVSDSEQLVNLELEEYKMNLDHQLNDVKFELDDEIEKAKTYQDEAVKEEIVQLQSNIDTLKDDLRSISEEKQSKLKEEMDKLEEEIHLTLKPKFQDETDLTFSLQQKKIELESANNKLTELQTQTLDIANSKSALEESIGSIESNINTFADRRELLLKELQEIERELTSTKEVYTSKESILTKSRNKYLDASEKLRKHDVQRRILENSIMDFTGKVRVYVKGEGSNNDEYHYSNKSYQFNKALCHLSSPQEISDEFSCLVKSILSNTNVTIVFTGESEHKLVTSCVLNSFKSILEKRLQLPDWHFSYNFRSIGVTSDNYFDRLNSNSKIDVDSFNETINQIQSQQMIISGDDFNQFSNILHESCYDEDSFDIIIYIINIDAKKNDKGFETNLVFLDLSRVEDQRAILEVIKNRKTCPRYPTFSKLIDFFYRQSRCLFFGNIISDERNWSPLLDALEVINCMESPYKRHN
ncbi:uncharacterized protein RJT20DRAFT_156577 [Scheffersomyces xylosifermentans]|uniref:uncharacterized protein n=1 Tax=Scheffersomyces xylosifermentans TaxID=1304137 RepID=UPI00315DF4AD